MLCVKAYAEACVRECRARMGLNDDCERRCCVRGYRMWSSSVCESRVYVCFGEKQSL